MLAQEIFRTIRDIEPPAEGLGHIALTDRAKPPLTVDRATLPAIEELPALHQQPEIQLILLTDGLIWIPSSHFDEDLSAKERSSRLRKLPAHEQAPRITRFSYIQEDPPRSLL